MDQALTPFRRKLFGGFAIRADVEACLRVLAGLPDGDRGQHFRQRRRKQSK